MLSQAFFNRISKMTTANISDALARLNRLLPLKEKQDRLDPSLRTLHREILRSFAERGCPPSRAQIAAQTGKDEVDTALQRLAEDDLIVLSPDRRLVTGAYPFTLEERAHRVTIGGVTVHAMCALDALSVAPMFEIRTRVNSVCHVSAAPVEILMQGEQLLSARPEHPCIGIRWQGTSGCAAQSLCMEMVFLADAATADGWQQKDRGNASVFDLPAAVAFGARFFRPLLA
jgi:hypothetical protein